MRGLHVSLLLCCGKSGIWMWIIFLFLWCKDSTQDKKNAYIVQRTFHRNSNIVIALCSPSVHPHGRAVGCQLCVFWTKSIVLYTGMYDTNRHIQRNYRVLGSTQRVVMQKGLPWFPRSHNLKFDLKIDFAAFASAHNITQFALVLTIMLHLWYYNSQSSSYQRRSWQERL